jgi:hypothetical protein
MQAIQVLHFTTLWLREQEINKIPFIMFIEGCPNLPKLDASNRA